jgi:hypothetical protein
MKRRATITPAIKTHLINRRRWLQGLVLIVAASLLMACSAASQIAVEPGEVDLGEISATDLVTSTLYIRNEGQGVLEISSLRTSCGCTTVEVDETMIKSGAEALMTISFDPQAHPGLYGPLLRMIYIESNDPNLPELEIPVTVHILAPEEASK